MRQEILDLDSASISRSFASFETASTITVCDANAAIIADDQPATADTEHRFGATVLGLDTIWGRAQFASDGIERVARVVLDEDMELKNGHKDELCSSGEDAHVSDRAQSVSDEMLEYLR